MAPTEGQKLRLYVDFMSQPSRAVVIFSRCNGLPVEVKPVLIHKGETRSPAYLAINPLGKVPLLEDPWVANTAIDGAALGDANGTAGSPVPSSSSDSNGSSCLRLPESAAMMSYLSYRFPDLVSEHWYPRTDLVQRARVDSALHWYQGTIRAGAMRVVFNKVIAQRLGLRGDEAVAEDGIKTLKLGLSALQSYWLAGGSQPFMTGPRLCAADLLAACELEQLVLLRPESHGVSAGEILLRYDVVRAWQRRVREACEPHYSEAHRVLWAAAATGKRAASAKL